MFSPWLAVCPWCWRWGSSWRCPHSWSDHPRTVWCFPAGSWCTYSCNTTIQKHKDMWLVIYMILRVTSGCYSCVTLLLWPYNNRCNCDVNDTHFMMECCSSEYDREVTHPLRLIAEASVLWPRVCPRGESHQPVREFPPHLVAEFDFVRSKHHDIIVYC